MLSKTALIFQLMSVGALVSVSMGAPECTADVDVIFVVDSSTSVEEADFRQQLTLLADLSDQFELAEGSSSSSAGAKFAAVVFSRQVAPVFDLGAFDKPASLREALVTAPYLAESSHTHAALFTVFQRSMFSTSKGGRAGARDVVVLVSDGKSSYPTETLIAAHHLKSQDVTIMTAGLTRDVDVVALRRLASSREDVFTLSEESDLKTVMAALTERLCQVAQS